MEKGRLIHFSTQKVIPRDRFGMSWNTFESRKNRRKRNTRLLVEQDETVIFSKKLANRRVEVEKDPYCRLIIERLVEWHRESLASTSTIICYGIGSIFHSAISQYQYGFLLELAKALQGTVKLYDPVSTNEEIKRFALDGFEFISFPARAHLGPSNIFFMPHCEGNVYRELLVDLGYADEMNAFWLYGNDLYTYDNDDDMKRYLDGWQCEKFEMAKSFGPRDDVFNDCYLQRYNKN